MEADSAAEGRLNEYRDLVYACFRMAAANADRVALMVGSNRQDYGTDAVNAYRNGTGYATSNFRYLQEDLAKSLGRDVELFRLLRADGDRAAGIEWDKIEAGKYTQSAEDIFQNLRNPNRPPGWIPQYTEAPRTDLKEDLLIWQIQRLREEFGPEQLLHVVFCDDRLDILQALARVDLMQDIKLTLIHMDYHAYVFNGEGSVQNTVVKLLGRSEDVFQDAHGQGDEDEEEITADGDDDLDVEASELPSTGHSESSQMPREFPGQGTQISPGKSKS